MNNLENKIKDIPKSPGVYKFYNKGGEVIYVGKAKNLKARVNQYFKGHDEREQIPYLMEEATDVDYIVVSSELESLFLESTLIKQYLPKYNIMLRDDKNYAFIKIDYSTQIPQIVIVRKIDDLRRHSEESDDEESQQKRSFTSFRMTPKARYFGPFTAAYKIRSTLNMIRRIFPYCSAQEVSGRPCFYYYLHRCPGVCVGKITLDEYNKQLEKIAMFLSGNTSGVIKELKNEMARQSKIKNFEAAAKIRDQLKSLELLEEKQIVILPKAVNWDVVSINFDQGYACANLFKVRKGKLFDKENFVYDTSLYAGRATGTVLETFLENYYMETSSVPSRVYIPYEIDNRQTLTELFKARFSKKADISVPKKGKTKELMTMGETNASEYLKNWLTSQAGHLDRINAGLTELKEQLSLPSVPKRIEGYDISNIQGTNAVGSMVVFKDGLPAKSEYRKFKIRSKSTPDDFAMMKEMLERRVVRIKNQESSIKDKNTWPIPDLIVIDGGKGQLGIAASIIQNSKFKIPVIGLAKRLEEIYLPNKKDPIVLPIDNPALQLLQRLRDEAHRFGITYHRNLRSKQAVRSALDDIPGIGHKTKKLLKEKFGTVKNIRQASLDELAAVVGERLAELIKLSL